MRGSAACIGAVLVLGLSACESDEESLDGERIPVRQIAQFVPDAEADRAVPLPAPARNDSWPQAGGNPAHAELHPDIESELSVLWSYGTGGGIDSQWSYVAEPIVSDGRVILLDGDGTVHAVEVDGGRQAWTTRIVPPEESDDDGVGGGLAASAGRIYVSTGFGELVTLAAEGGEILWRISLDAPVRAAPVVSQGQVAVLARDDVLRVFDAATGDPKWDARGAGASTTFLYAASPAIRGDVMVAPYGSGELVGYAGGDGSKLWSEILAGGVRDSPIAALADISAAPVLDERYVFAGTRRGEFIAVDWLQGIEAWRREIGVGGRAWALGDSIFLIDVAGNLMRLSKVDGTAFWRRALPIYEDPEDREDPIFYAGPVVAGGRLLLVSSLEELLSFDADTGEPGEVLDIGAPARVVPVVADGTVYVFRDDGVLVALR